MRKYENVDIVSSLGAVVELNTEHYKSDFKYDIEMFKEAAKNPNGENNRLLWLSRQSGTYCHLESDVKVMFISKTRRHLITGKAVLIFLVHKAVSRPL